MLNTTTPDDTKMFDLGCVKSIICNSSEGGIAYANAHPNWFGFRCVCSTNKAAGR